VITSIGRKVCRFPALCSCDSIEARLLPRLLPPSARVCAGLPVLEVVPRSRSPWRRWGGRRTLLLLLLGSISLSPPTLLATLSSRCGKKRFRTINITCERKCCQPEIRLCCSPKDHETDFARERCHYAALPPLKVPILSTYSIRAPILSTEFHCRFLF
jgi:hypothetical protein